ncbi:DUF2905 domain-containing protein [Thermosediminibacter litoriperuensis]|uniref:DUF2905 family protein n=1 Tax=Thermosediminibacter litoriperuensis TaxID=291989 RepID=A0A5S5AG04_9FIRM|nr:DUF2905 domain-containing protein [Thermosediminibacter litoriperuensis]TYP48704.1 Protein of unknown function (DUF2905) [Thermosediminibacter litoriperuensis]
MFSSFGKILILTGLLMVVTGGVFLLISSMGLGKLPGDIVVRRGNFVFYFPLATGLVLSLILTLILNIIRR